MLTLLGQPTRRMCDGLRRRSFLTIGSLALGGATLSSWCAAADQPRRKTKSVIMIYLTGGPPHQDMIDLKPDAPSEFRGEFVPISTSVPGIQICELLPELAKRTHKLALIRSIIGTDGAHASTLCVTGHPWGNQPPGGHPHFGAVASTVLGHPIPTIPSTIDLSTRMQHTPYNLPGAGYLGASHAPFRPQGEATSDMDVSPEGRIRLDDRSSLLASFDRYRDRMDRVREIRAVSDSQKQALDVLTSSALRTALDVSQESPETLERYGKDDWDALPYSRNGYPVLPSRFLMARRLIEAGVRVVSLSYADFDYHGANFAHCRKTLPPFDKALSALIDDLEVRGLLDDTAIVCWGEFGRTPRINKDAGRDHWGGANMAILAGGGWNVGQVIGGTDRLAEQVVDRPVKFQEVHATIYRHLGIANPNQTTYDDPLAHRPRLVVDEAKPLKELVS